MRGIRVGLWMIMLIVVAAGAAMAQATTGTLRGHVADAQGLALPGVTVSATSPNLQGTRTAVTSENGDYVLTLLPSGSYTVSFELSGFERQQRSVALAPMQDLPVDMKLGIATLTETVQVVGGDVIRQTPQVTVNYSQALIDALPNNRDLNAAVLQAPAVHATGPRGAYSIGGAASFESLIMVNGVATTDNLRGTPYDLYIEDAIQETAVSVSGVSAEHGRFSGGVVNVITKSGGNDFSGSFRNTYNNDSWRALSPFEKTSIAADPQHKELRLDKSVPTYEYTFGGPAMKDKLWFFTAGRLQKQSSGRTLNVTRIPYTYEDKTRRYEAKGTYSQSASHRFQVNYLKIQQDEANYTFNGASSASMDERSLGTRSTPQDLYAIGYTGFLTPQLSVEARYSARHFKFVGAGARTTDPIEGTLLLDQSRSPNGRYWADTFCGVCTPEKRDNEDYFFKGTYFLSSKGLGSHNMIFGYDNFDDIREANNHQSGSDFRIYGTGIWLDGTAITPKFLGDDSTLIQYNPITKASQGSDFRTHSLFYNDTWRVSDRVTANLGLRWDKNHGLDQSGALVVHDGRFSPRLGLVWDPTGSGKWSVTGSFGKYVAAISNGIADNSSSAGNPQTYIYYYRGPSVNASGPGVSTPAAIKTVLDWYQANINNLVLEENPDLPGLTPQIGDNLRSPFVYEYSTGVSRQIGSRASVRIDGSYRKYHDFYAERIDGATGKVKDSFGQEFDLSIIENTDALTRQYAGLIFQGNYRVSARTQAGAQYTLSRAWGNFEGEDVNSGPLPSDSVQYPEYKQESWNYPEGDLQVDQRHRARLYLTYGVPKLEGLVFSVQQTLESGVPYGASNLNATAKNGVDPRPFVTGAPDYENPPSGQSTIYFFTPRDAFRTEGQKRTDFAVSYAYNLKTVRGLPGLQLFAQAQVINLFDQSQLCGCGQSVFLNGGSVTQTNIDTTVRTAVTTSSLKTFNPFVETPVEGVNWAKGPAFGTARNRFAYTSPRQFRFSFGVRF